MNNLYLHACKTLYPMKRLLTVVLIPLSMLMAAAQEKDPRLEAEYAERICRVGVNMSPYEYLPGPHTPAPKGYKPFYISHYGRHGSRSNWGSKYDRIQKKYHDAFDAGVLTPLGVEVMEQIDLLIRNHDNMDGRLTYLGTREHAQIAARMYKNYRPVFRSGSKKISARSSIVPRCIVSMAAFTGELMELEKDLDIRWDTGTELMKILSTDDPKWIRDSCHVFRKQLSAAHVPDTAAFKSKIFTDPEKGRSICGDPVTMMKQTFDMATGTAAFEMDETLYRVFSMDELYWYAAGLNMEFYLRQCNSIPFGDVRMEPVRALAQDVLEKAENAIETGEWAADLRFGHDYQLLAFASWMGLEGVGERMDQTECTSWPGWKYTPFGGNIQLIFYKNKAGDVRVKVLMNERETRVIGLEGFPYYKWEDFRKCLER